MRLAWRTAGWLVAAALVGYFLWFAGNTLDFRGLEAIASPSVIAALLIAASLYATIIPVSAWAWAILLARQGEAWRVSLLAVVLGRVQLAKYLPGNVAQHAGRAMLSLRNGMGGRAFAVTVVQENVLATAASVLVGVLALAISAPGIAQLPDGARSWLLGAGILFAVAVLLLASFDLPPDRLALSPSRFERMLGHLGGLPGGRVVLPALAAYVLNYLVIGLGLWIVARAAGMPAALDLAIVTAVFSLAWLLGFLAPGAPAGLGVREGIMVLLLAGIIPDADALAFVLLARVVTLAGDAIIYLTSLLYGVGGGKDTESI